MMSYAYHEYHIFKVKTASYKNFLKAKKGVSGENVSLTCTTIFQQSMCPYDF